MAPKTPINQNGPTGRRTLRIISNFSRLDGVCTERFSVAHQFVGDAETLWSGIRLFFEAFYYDVVVLNSSTRRLLVFCLLRWLLPFHRCRLLAVDFRLSQPVGWGQRLVSTLKRLLLRKVDRFIPHFVDLEGYNRFYGISPARCSFVPFKVNSWEVIPPKQELSAEGEYIFTAGRSFRDLPTFIAAMRQVSYPGLLLYENTAVMNACGTELDLQDLPSNLRAEAHDGERSWIEYIRRAKLVVVPLLSSSIYAPGLSLYLMAMALRKCVIITEGPATRGLLTGEAIIVPQGDPVSLASAIRRAWEDDNLREGTADAGRRYAERLGGEPRLLSDIVDICGDLVQGEIPLYGGRGQPPPSNP